MSAGGGRGKSPVVRPGRGPGGHLSHCHDGGPAQIPAHMAKKSAARRPKPIDLVARAIEQFGRRPSWDEYFMATAKLIASRSTCERLNVGCIVVTAGRHRNRIVAAGYNGFLPGAPHASRVRDGHEQATVHAEQNAIADAARRGSSVEGCIVYVTHFPCINCAKIMASSGIAEIRYHEDYHNDPLVKPLLAGAGVRVTRL